MWISQIELVCFKSYQSQTFQFPSPESDKNIVVIGGMNGYGKTTILEALYLCLYGKDAMAHLARAGLKINDNRGYPTFLERAFNGEALRDQRDTMMVRVIINKNKSKAIDISRKWYFRSNGTWAAEEETIVRNIVRGVPQTPKRDGTNNFRLSDVLDDFFVPAHIAPFFFFDGEEVKKLADQSRIEQIKQGLEGLLGVVLLRNLADRLKNFENSRRTGVSNVDEDKLAETYNELESGERRYQFLKKEIDELDRKGEQLKEERKSLINRITAAGGGSGDIANVKDLVETREQYRNQQKDKLAQLETILAEKLPFHLVSKELLNNFKSQIQSEMRFFEWETDKKSLEPRKKEFESAFLSEATPEINPELTDEQSAAIKSRMDAAWASLFYPPPEDCAKEIVHSYMHSSLRNKTLDYFDTIALGQKEIKDLLSEQNSLQQEVDELSRKITRLEGIDRDGTLTKLKADLSAVGNDIDEIGQRIRNDDRVMHSVGENVKNLRAEYEREKKKLDDSSPAREVIKKSERVRHVIEQVIPKLFPLKVNELAEAMTKVYKQLAHKKQVAKIEINNDGSTRILGKTGKEIEFDRSAGENQIFATALIAGLAKVSGIKAPMVVDTPLGRLDSHHRENILKFWTDNKKRQVILLSQDEEIDEDFLLKIKGSISKTYLLEHIDVGDGIGRTVAKADEYFGDQK